MWTFYNSPFKGQQDLSYDAALILVVLVLVLIIGSRLDSQPDPAQHREELSPAPPRPNTGTMKVA